MILLKRIKRGSTVVRYLVKDDEIEAELDAEAVAGVAPLVTNATYIGGVDFRAKVGCKIETVQLIGKDEHSKKVKVASEGYFSNVDYYGKNFISVCRVIRDCIKHGRIRVIRGNCTIDILKLVEACDLSMEEFIQGYLSTLQPYMLQESGNNIWFCEIGNKLKMIIELGTSNNGKLVTVVFDDSLRGSSDFSYKSCAVFVDRFEKRGNFYSVDYTVQHGLVGYSVHSITEYLIDDVAVVSYKHIKDRFTYTVDYLHDVLHKVYGEKADKFILSNISANSFGFLFKGFDFVNSISYLVELYNRYTDTRCRTLIADYTLSLLNDIPDKKLIQVRDKLREKYGDSDSRLYLALL